MRYSLWSFLALLFLARGCAAPSGLLEATTPSTPMAVDSCESTRSGAPAVAQGPTPQEAVSSFLDAGGRPDRLSTQLYERGWVIAGSAFISTDLDGDSDRDLAVGLLDASSPDEGASNGAVLVWRCQAGSYVVLRLAESRSDHRLPVLQEATDLTGDGSPELVVAHPRCGAHTCTADFSVFQSAGGEWLERFLGPTDDLPSPQWRVHPAAPGKPAEIEIVAGGIGSVGAGPYRLHSRSWRWDGALPGFAPVSEWVEPPRFRIHLIHEADDAFQRREATSALDLYRRVIQDETLLDWPGAGDGRETLAGYAAFRRVLAFLAAGDVPSARLEFESRLEAAAGPGAAFAPLARALLESFPEPGLRQGCALVIRMVEERPDSILGPLAYGYANRSYTPSDICPAG